MKSDNLTQLSGLLIIDVITNEKKSFAAFTIGRKVGEDTHYMNSIAFPNLKFKIPFDILTLGNSIFVAGYLNSNKHIEGVSPSWPDHFTVMAGPDRIQILIPDYKNAWHLDTSVIAGLTGNHQQYQAHIRYFLIDSQTGYRSREQQISVRFEV